MSKVQNIATFIGTFCNPNLIAKEETEKNCLIFSLATPKASKNNQSEGSSDFFEFVCFGELAKKTFDKFKKGNKIEVVAIPYVDTYTTKDGKTVNNKKFKAVDIMQASTPFEATDENGNVTTHWIEKFTCISNFVGKYYEKNFHQSSDGSNVCLNFSLGIPKALPSRNKDNAFDFFNFVAFGHQADQIHKSLEKGEWIQIVAIPYNDCYVKEDEKRINTNFKVIYFQRCGKSFVTKDGNPLQTTGSKFQEVEFKDIEVEKLEA